MIRFTSAKFQLNIHEVFILLGLKHLHHQSFEGGCCGEGHFFGDLLEGNENEQKKKKKKKEERGEGKTRERSRTKWKANDYIQQSSGTAERHLHRTWPNVSLD